MVVATVFSDANLPRLLKNDAASVRAICFVVEIVISESATIRPEPSAKVIKTAALVLVTVTNPFGPSA